MENKMTTIVSPYKIFNVEDKEYYYNIKNSGIFEYDGILKAYLESNAYKNEECDLESCGYTQEETREFIANALNAEIIIDEKKHEKCRAFDINKNVNSVTLMVSQMCNLRCEYCYGEGGEFNHKPGIMKFEVAKKAIDLLVEKSPSNKLLVAFMGGEPLMNFDLIKKVVEYCSSIENKEFVFTMTTNGTLITEEFENYIKDKKFNVQISIDGAKEQHDKRRYFINKKPTYDMIMRKTANMRKEGKLTARATLSSGNLDYIKVFDTLENMGFTEIPLAVAKNMLKEDDKKLELDQYKKYVDYFVSLMQKKDFAKAKKMLDLYMNFTKIKNAGRHTKGCGAFRNSIAVNIDGNIYPCHRFVGSEKFCMGDVDKKEILNKERTSDERCKNCWLSNLCLGGCAYENNEVNEDIDIPDNTFCEKMKYMYSKLIPLYISMSYSEEKELG